jgi:predicted DNA-binding protein
MQGKSVSLGVRVPEELKERLTALAKQERRTVSQLVMLILTDYVEGRLVAKKNPPR